MSSPASSADADEPISKSKTSSPERAIAFLVHSPNSMLNGLPPDVDNKPLARQRRRRTSPDDQKILEDAFAVNPRPDKAARMEILTRVALGDKEVQIWFQNRRQNSRRKGKPVGPASSPLNPKSRSQTPGAEEQVVSRRVEEQTETVVTVEQPVVMTPITRETSIDSATNGTSDEKERRKEVQKEDQENDKDENREADVQEESQNSFLAETIASSQDQAASTYPTEFNNSQSVPSSQDAISSYITKPTYLANRRSASFVRQQAEEVGVAVQSKPAAPNVARTLSRSGSNLRLSMTDDGQARVIDRSVPSPPRSQPVAPVLTKENEPSSLRRSYSAAGLNDIFKQSAAGQAAPSKVPRISITGRSRDSRAWEFWCDSEARNSLAQTAEQESSGSAADAIGLIRQNSRSAFRPNSRKANSPMVVQGGFTAINKAAKPGLQRASTTYGRLQGKNATEEEWERPTGDSDKENWDPEDNHAAPRRRAHPSAPNVRRERAVLGENTKLPSYQSSLGGLMDSEKKRGAVADVDAEVAAFMGTETEEIGDDLDCVQSLLSLSKGNWR